MLILGLKKKSRLIFSIKYHNNLHEFIKKKKKGMKKYYSFQFIHLQEDLIKFKEE